jgi:hypothetical protein
VRQTVVASPPIVRERTVVVTRPAYVPPPVLRLPGYGYAEGALRRYRLVSASDGKSARSWPPPGALDSIRRGASDRLVRQHLGRQNDS